MHVNYCCYPRGQSVDGHIVPAVDWTSQTAILSGRCRDSEGSWESDRSCDVCYPTCSLCHNLSQWVSVGSKIWIFNMKWKAKLRFCTQELNTGDGVKHSECMKVNNMSSVSDSWSCRDGPAAWPGCFLSSVQCWTTHFCFELQLQIDDWFQVSPSYASGTNRWISEVCVSGFLSTECSCSATERWGECFIPLLYLLELWFRAHSELRLGLKWVGSQKVRCRNISLHVCADIYRVWTDAQKERSDKSSSAQRSEVGLSVICERLGLCRRH